MGKLILKNDDGTEILIRDDVNESLLPWDVVLRSEHIAMKLWSREDISLTLEYCGYEPSEENIDKVLNTQISKCLNDCTDYDWEIIDQAIYEANKLYKLSRKEN